MLLLTSTSDLVQLITDASADIRVHASWVDLNAGTISPSRTNTASITGAATTTVVGSPAASTQRNVKHLSIRNNHASTTCNVTVQHTDSVNVETLIKVPLLAGESLVFDQEGVWSHYNTSGGLYPTGPVPTGTGFRHVTSGVEDAATKLVDTADVNANQITNAKLAQMVQATIKGRASGAGTGDPVDLTAAQALTILAAFSILNVQVFTSTGSNTYTPTSGMKWCLVFSTGAGGGGGGADLSAAGTANISAGGGGGAGGTCIEFFAAATIGASQTVTIGTGGTAGSATNGTAGGGGGNTTFGALHTATGGSGGGAGGVTAQTAQIAAGGAGGVPTGGLANLTGGAGTAGVGTGTTTSLRDDGGIGGESMWGGGGDGGHIAQTTAALANSAGGNGSAPGSGAGGGVVSLNTTGTAGGAGANGLCVVIEFA